MVGFTFRVRRCVAVAIAVAVAVAGALTAIGLSTAAAAAEPTSPPAPAEDSRTEVRPAAFRPSPGAGAVIGSVLVLWGNGVAVAFVDVPVEADQLEFDVEAVQCTGLPRIELAVDGQTVFAREVAGKSKYSVGHAFIPGTHKIVFRFTNDLVSANCDRNVKFRNIAFSGTAGDRPPTPVLVHQALIPRFAAVSPASAGTTYAIPKLWTNGSLNFSLDSQAASHLSFTIWPVECEGLPSYRLRVDGGVVSEGVVPESGVFGVPSVVEIQRNWSDGTHAIEFQMLDDYRTLSCDRALNFESVQFSGLAQGFQPPAATQASMVFRSSVLPSTFSYSPGAGASSGNVAVLWANGTGSAWIDLTRPMFRLQYDIEALQCEGLPQIEVAVDGVALFGRQVAGFGRYAIPGNWVAGRHKIAFRFLNDLLTDDCDRNLKLRNVAFTAGAPDGDVVPVQTTSYPSWQYASITPGKAGVLDVLPYLWTPGSVAVLLDSQGSKRLKVTLGGTACNGYPAYSVSVDEILVASGRMSPESSGGPGQVFYIDRDWSNGTHDIRVDMLDDERTETCDRSLRVDSVQFLGSV